MKHIPVLLSETIDGLGLGDFNAKKVVVDATL